MMFPGEGPGHGGGRRGTKCVHAFLLIGGASWAGGDDAGGPFKIGGGNTRCLVCASGLIRGATGHRGAVRLGRFIPGGVNP